MVRMTTQKEFQAYSKLESAKPISKVLRAKPRTKVDTTRPIVRMMYGCSVKYAFNAKN